MSIPYHQLEAPPLKDVLIEFRAVNWDEPDRHLDWMHSASSILQAGPCIRSNQLDFDEEVMFKSTRYLYAAARRPASARPFCLTVSLTHPHDPYTINKTYWDRYAGVDIPQPNVKIPQAEQDAHSQRLLKVCGLWDNTPPEEAVERARRAYYGAMSYVDDNVGKLLEVLKECGMEEDTIVIFSSDHGDMLGERGLWYVLLPTSNGIQQPLASTLVNSCSSSGLNEHRYKMAWFEASARVPLLISYPKRFEPGVINHVVSSMDLLPTLVDLVGQSTDPRLPLDGQSLVPFLEGNGSPRTVYGEYVGEGTIAPLMMIRRGSWKFVTCPVDPPQLFNLDEDPRELTNLATSPDTTVKQIFRAFELEANARWDFKHIHAEVLKSQRSRKLCWDALTRGRFQSWDYQPRELASEQ